MQLSLLFTLFAAAATTVTACGSINGNCNANGCEGTAPVGGPGFCTAGQFAGCQCGNNCNGAGPCGQNGCNGEFIDGMRVCTAGEFVGCSCA